MKPTTPDSRQNLVPPVGKGSRDGSGAKGHAVKNKTKRSNQLIEQEKA